MTTTDVLKAAREHLASVAFWQGGPSRIDGREMRVDESYPPSDCAVTAISFVGSPMGSRIDARKRLAKAIGLPDGEVFTIADWNDAPERTKAEVLAAFDRAIKEVPNEA